MLTYFQDEDFVVTISDAGRTKWEDETSMARVDRLYAEIKIAAAGGALLTIAGLIAKQLLGS